MNPRTAADTTAVDAPTDVPPADVPPADVSPADVSPTDVSPTDVPPADVSSDTVPVDVAPAAVPASEVRPAATARPGGSLAAESLSLAYDEKLIVDDLTLSIPPEAFTVIVGANACGKSTLLRGLARLLSPKTGTVLLDGQDIHGLPTREVATRLGILPQQPIAPEGISVADLVARGRYPHQRWFRQWSTTDEAAVDAALAATQLTHLASQPVDELSGGQRQRVWIALALAQGTDLMLLDEPTTFLDLAHQVEVLDLLAELNAVERRTIVAVLHDLNLACRYAHHLVAMKDGAIVCEGPPSEVITPANVREVFGLDCQILPDPLTGTPLVLPVPAHRRT